VSPITIHDDILTLIGQGVTTQREMVELFDNPRLTSCQGSAQVEAALADLEKNNKVELVSGRWRLKS